MRLLLLSLLYLLAFTSGECPGACNGHGTCGAYDMCTCYKGFMGGDCSQRMCQFGRAHVDIPKGDIDASGTITGPDVQVGKFSNLWPQGTSEQYPFMTDSTFVTVLDNTAHEYVECSNKGDCNRDTGKCVCIPGYEGSACQRTACPITRYQVCNGHGICRTAREIAKMDHDNIYELWDADITTGCVCDPGYEGPGCEFKSCKQGYDPLFLDPEDSRRYTNISYVIYVRDRTAVITGNYSLEFHDINKQRWRTRAISYGAECYDVIDALESLPNNVIPYGSVRCNMWTHYNTIPQEDEPIYYKYSTYYGMKYTLAFPANPGILEPLQVVRHLDGKRPTLFSSEANSTLNTFIYPNGFIGERTEFFVDKCIGVDLTLTLFPGYMDGKNYMSEFSYFTDLDPLETRLLQKCLGDADGLASTVSASGTIGGVSYDWDFGSVYNPHLVRLVQTTVPSTVVTDLCDRRTDEEILSGQRTVISSSRPSVDGGRSGNRGRTCQYDKPNPGFYAALYYDNGWGRFVLMNRPSHDYDPDTKFAIWTTTGVAQMVSDEAMVYTRGEPDEIYSNTVYSTNSSSQFPEYTGEIDCTNNAERHGAFTCLDKGDYVFFLDKDRPDRNPEYFNIYTTTKIYVERHAAPQRQNSRRNRIQLNHAINADYLNPNMTWSVRAYKFNPPTGYDFVTPCSNRGLCNLDYGQCRCFAQFTMDDCSILNNFGN